jgi:hypothetical protein
MEVHHHSHTPDNHRERKKWTHYFWEFIMLFLAVFCGFFAEYQLEHKIERDRAKELAGSFYEELKNDSAAVQTAVTNWQRKDSAITYLIKYFADSSILNCSKKFSRNFFFGLAYNSPTVFEPGDVILDQLKNSGSLRYFKNKKLQTLIGNLSMAIVNLQKRNELEQSYLEQNVLPFLLRHNDAVWYQQIQDKKVTINGGSMVSILMHNYDGNAESIPFHFNGPENFRKIESLNMLQIYQLLLTASRQNQYYKYQNLNKQILVVLRKEYDLK